jgi:uncharacterized phiE125 gp8 family phage protein
MVVYSKVTSAPATEPIEPSEAKTHLRVTSSADDTYITTLIKVARQLCESYAQKSFITQTRTIKLDYFPSCDKPIYLPYGPVIAITAFTYTNDDAGTTSMVANTDYVLDTHSDIARVVPIDGWPTDVADTTETANAITITYTAGYGAAAAVPEIIKQAILMQVGTLYENRQSEVVGVSSSMIHVGAQALLDTVKSYHNAWQD